MLSSWLPFPRPRSAAKMTPMAEWWEKLMAFFELNPKNWASLLSIAKMACNSNDQMTRNLLLPLSSRTTYHARTEKGKHPAHKAYYLSRTKASTRLTLSCNFTSQIKRTSRQERCRDVSISLRLPWAAQWESAVALESDDPRRCIFSGSARDLSRLQIILSSK